MLSAYAANYIKVTSTFSWKSTLSGYLKLSANINNKEWKMFSGRQKGKKTFQTQHPKQSMDRDARDRRIGTRMPKENEKEKMG